MVVKKSDKMKKISYLKGCSDPCTTKLFCRYAGRISFSRDAFLYYDRFTGNIMTGE